MVNRCFYYVESGIVKWQVVNIEWDCGFTKEAKEIYIDRIISRVPEKYKPCADITTASPDPVARSLSPHLMKLFDGRKFDTIYAANPTPPQHDWVYYQCLTGGQLEFIRNCSSFVDVFHDPFKKGINTQAHSAAVVKLFLSRNLSDETDSYEDFERWWLDVDRRSKEYADSIK